MSDRNLLFYAYLCNEKVSHFEKRARIVSRVHTIVKIVRHENEHLLQIQKKKKKLERDFLMNLFSNLLHSILK